MTFRDQTAAGADDQRVELAQPPAPDEPAPVMEQLKARIEELTGERDQARLELDQARQELELAHHVQARADQTTPVAVRSASNSAMR
jgi:hypothetical protein